MAKSQKSTYLKIDKIQSLKKPMKSPILGYGGTIKRPILKNAEN